MRSRWKCATFFHEGGLRPAAFGGACYPKRTRQFVTFPGGAAGEFPDDPKRKALAIRRVPLTFVFQVAVVAAGVLEELLNEAVTSGPHKNKKHVKSIKL